MFFGCIIGKTEKVTPFLEILPKKSHHFIELAVGALYRVLRNINEVRQAPMKKLYRKHKKLTSSGFTEKVMLRVDNI